MAAATARPSLGIVPYVVAGCQFMENLDATVIVTALPAIARSFRVDTGALSLGISAYLVAVAIMLPLGTWLADRFGTRSVMAVSIVLFVAASLLCGVAQDLRFFVAMRVVQGAAAALMSPSGRLAVLRDTPRAHIVHAVAIFTWPSLFAPVLGPPLGGFLTSYASWRWIFFLNLPIGAIGLALALRYVPQQRSAAPGPLDVRGFMLAGLTLAAIVFGIELVGAGRTLAGIALAGGGIAIGIATVRHLRRAAVPLVGLAPFGIRSFAVTVLSGGTFTRIAIGATPFLLPLMFQAVFHLSAFAAGALTLVYFAGNLGMKLFTTQLLRRFGFRDLLVANGLLTAGAVALCALVATGLPIAAVVPILLAGGATRSLQFTALSTLAFAEVPKTQAGDANTLSTLSQQMGVALGVSVAALILHGAWGSHIAGALTAADFERAFLVVAAIGVAALPFYARLGAHVGQEVSGHAIR